MSKKIKQKGHKVKLSNKMLDSFSKKRKRDENGKFTTGSGGLSFAEKIKWGRVLPVLIAITLVGGLLVFQSFAAVPSDKYWKLVWSDEFDGVSLDTSKWNVYDKSNFGSSNNQDECSMKENVTVSGGSLNLTAKKEQVQCGGKNPNLNDIAPGVPNKTYYFTSGAITSRALAGQPSKFKFKQGYIEARIKSPKGNPYWPAFWLTSPVDGPEPGWPAYGEFDVYEGLGARPDNTMGTLHYQCPYNPIIPSYKTHCTTSPGSIYNIKTMIPGNSSSNYGYHINSQATYDAYPGGGITDYVLYGFEWENDQISWYLNGRKFRYLNKDGLFRIESTGKITKEKTLAELGEPRPTLEEMFNYNHSIILNLAVGGVVPMGSRGGYTGKEIPTGGYDMGNFAADVPGVMKVDYVRVYQKDASTVPQKLQSPINVAAVPAENSVKLSWSGSAILPASHYMVRYIKSDSTEKNTIGAWSRLPQTTSLISIVSNLQPNIKYDFQVQAIDSSGANQASDFSNTVTAAPLAPIVVTPPKETGLKAYYYPSVGYSGKPVSRIDKKIDFEWGNAAPIAGMEENFHIRWSGKITPTKTDLYTITAASDDGMTVWMNGRQLINSWKKQSLTEKSSTIQLEAGRDYDIEVDYFDGASLATAKLFWQTVSLPKQIIPTEVLSPTANSGLSGRYFGSGTARLRNDKTINFDWAYGSPHSALGGDNFYAGWIGTITAPVTDTYTFTTLTDDGGALWIDGQSVISDLNQHSVKENSGKVQLIAGKSYPITMFYFENKGLATAKLLWSRPGVATSVVAESSLRTN